MEALAVCPRCSRPLVHATTTGIRVPFGSVEDLTGTTITIRCSHRHPAGNGRCNGRLSRTLESLMPKPAVPTSVSRFAIREAYNH